MDAPYYGRDLALVHHLGYGFHAVVELGCGSGLLTRHHRVLRADARSVHPGDGGVPS